MAAGAVKGYEFGGDVSIVVAASALHRRQNEPVRYIKLADFTRREKMFKCHAAS